MRTRCIAALALAIAGCHDLPDVASDECGNRVLDPGEDCDGDYAVGSCGSSDSDNACYFVCDREIAGQDCPTGWGCGLDGRCRAPSSDFSAAPDSPWRFPVDTFAIGDVDGDGNADLIGHDLAAITVRYGTATGAFPNELEFNIRRPQGAAAFGYLDDDELLDAVVPIEEGLFGLLGDENRTLEPVAAAPFDLDQSRIRMAPIDLGSDTADAVVVMDLTASSMSLVGSPTTSTPLPVDSTAFDLAPALASANVFTSDGAGRDELALAFAGTSSVFVYRAGDAPDPLRLVQVAEIAVPGEILAGTVFADVDGDGLLDLLVSYASSGGSRIAVAPNQGDDSFGPAIREPAFERPTGGGIEAELPLAAADLDGDDRFDFVFSEAVMLNGSGGGGGSLTLLPIAYAITAPWSDAVTGDFNGDGRVDVAVTSALREGIDVLLGSELGPFNRFDIGTETPPRTAPRTLTAGDFDGDKVDDLAFAELGRQLGSEPQDREPDRLSVVFGARDGGFGVAVSMGELGIIEQIVAHDAFSRPETFDSITDLYAVSARDGRRARSLMLGDSSRRMISPFILDPGGDGRPHVPHRAVVGNFTSDDSPDVLSIAADPDNERAPVAWLVPGRTGDGSLDGAAARFVPLPDDDVFDAVCAAWAVGDLDQAAAGPRDELVGLDDIAACAEFGADLPAEPTVMVAHILEQVDGPGGPFAVEAIALGDELLGPENVALVDLDDDGDRDLLVLFRGLLLDGSGVPTGSGVAVYWNQLGTPVIEGRSIILLTSRELSMVAAIHLDADEFYDLAILSDEGVHGSRFDPDTGDYGEPFLLIPGFFGKLFAVGDVNGDGLDDIAVANRVDVAVWLASPQPALGGATPPSALERSAGEQR